MLTRGVGGDRGAELTDISRTDVAAGDGGLMRVPRSRVHGGGWIPGVNVCSPDVEQRWRKTTRRRRRLAWWRCGSSGRGRCGCGRAAAAATMVYFRSPIADAVVKIGGKIIHCNW